MKRILDFEVLLNDRLTPNVYRLVMKGDTSDITAAGQFVDVAVPGLFLRRPISVCDVDGDKMTLVYKVVGKGTERMANLKKGDCVNVLTGLGNGYDLSLAGERPLLAGGGVGVPPLYLLAKKLIESGVENISVALGFNTKSDVILADEFAAIGCDVKVATADGSYGVKGVVTDAIEGEFTHYYACGSLPMLKAVTSTLKCTGSVSMEARMGCGFGACMGCTLLTKNGPKRVCKEGPVFDAEEIIW